MIILFIRGWRIGGNNKTYGFCYPFSFLFLPVFLIRAYPPYPRHPRSILIGWLSTARAPCSASPRFFTSISPSYKRASHDRGASGMRKSAAGAGNS
jgi:hypothetical protein